ncbi:hypothetical protein HA402_007744 [Bradysia odoriphaga]|nr:hypothetical protein HA402_007744 [Bradysia odoriphaga]
MSINPNNSSSANNGQNSQEIIKLERKIKSQVIHWPGSSTFESGEPSTNQSRNVWYGDPSRSRQSQSKPSQSKLPLPPQQLAIPGFDHNFRFAQPLQNQASYVGQFSGPWPPQLTNHPISDKLTITTPIEREVMKSDDGDAFVPCK